MIEAGAKPIPVEADAGGILRIAGTRVPVDNVLHEFLAGASAEEIVCSYPAVPLEDVYTLIGHTDRSRPAPSPARNRYRDRTGRGLGGVPDSDVLAWAADADRVVLTHDVTTLVPEAYSRVAISCSSIRRPTTMISKGSFSFCPFD